MPTRIERTHTPGPWMVLSYHPLGIKDEAIIVGPQMEARPPIAKCHLDNAALIAVAPELLEVTKKLVEMYSDVAPYGQSPIVEKAKVAIAKAERR